MAFDGNGNYVRIHNWTADAANALDINAGEMDAEDSSIAGAFNITVTRDGQGKMAADFTAATDNVYNLGTAARRWASINSIPIAPLSNLAGDIRNYGAITGVDCAGATQSAAAANQLVIFPAGVWAMATTPSIPAGVVMQALPGAIFSGAGASALGFTTGAIQQEIQETSTAIDFATHYFRRIADYTGGTAGVVSSCVRAETWVTNAAVANYEWALTAVMHNTATGGQNVAGYLLGNRDSSTAGPTWGAVIDVEETVPINNPTTGLIGLEVDNRSNGTDANNARIGIDVACTRHNTSGAATVIGYGVRVQTNRDGANSTIGIAFGIDGPSTVVDIGFDASIATCVQAAFKMSTNQVIAFDSASLNTLSYNTSGLVYAVSGVPKTELLASGGLAVGATQVVGGQVTGYGTPTGGSRIASFPGGSATLAQTSAMLAQLMLDLKTHGLIGT